MRTRIKVCCIASMDEAELAINGGADALGLVACMPSGSGAIPDPRIREIAAAVPPPISTFLLTAETTADRICAHVRATNPTTVQIVSHIDPAEAARLSELEPHVRRVQVVHVETQQVLKLIPAYAPHVHAFLLDSGRPSAAIPELGGTGRVHDWAISAKFVNASPRPVFLAGGLNAANVGQAIEQVRPFGVDLCSSVRSAGSLDPPKLAAFVAAVRQADLAAEAQQHQ
jgi:phosphoribosylanthranilate isomerase